MAEDIENLEDGISSRLKNASTRISEISMETSGDLAAPALSIDGSKYLIPISSYSGSNGEVCRFSVINQKLKIDWATGGVQKTNYIDFTG